MISRSALIIGGNGCLGQSMVKAFTARKWNTLNVDFTENKAATANLLLGKDFHTNIGGLYADVEQFSKKVDTIICVAGGFACSNIKDSDIIN